MGDMMNFVFQELVYKFTVMEWEWLKTAIDPLKDILVFLNKESKTNDVLKKQLIIELRNNLNIFSNGFKNNVSPDVLIELLTNEAYKDAIKNNFKFKKLKSGKIAAQHVREERNKRYIGWDAERLADKIDEKIEELKNIRKMHGGTISKAKNDIPQMLSNLFYRMKLMADFIKGSG